MAAGAVSLRNSHDIVILSFCNVVKGQANCREAKLLYLPQEQKSYGFFTFWDLCSATTHTCIIFCTFFP